MKENTTIDSGSHVKTIFKKGSPYFLVSLFTKIISLTLLPVITSYLTPAENGVLSTLESIGQFLPVAISLGLDEAYFRYFYKYNKSESELKNYVSTYFWGITIFGSIVVVVGIILGNIFLTKELDITVWPFIVCTMVGPLVVQISVLGSSFLRQQLKTGLLSLIILVSYLSYIGVFMFLLVNQHIGMQAKVYGLFLQNLIMFFSYAFILFKNNLIGFKFKKSILIEGLYYSLPLLPNQMSWWISGMSDRILLTVLKSKHDTGIYSLGYIIGQSLVLFSNSIFNVYKPMMFSMFSKDKEHAVKKIEQFIPNYWFFMFWIAFGIGFFGKELILVCISNTAYRPAYIIIPVVVTAYLFGAMYKPFYNIISYFGKTWIISISAIVQALINLVLNITFIPKFGNIAAAWSTVVSFFIAFLWLWYFSNKMIKVKVDMIKVGLILVSGAVTFMAWCFVESLYKGTNIWITILLKLLMYGVGACSLIVLRVFDVSELLKREK